MFESNSALSWYFPEAGSCCWKRIFSKRRSRLRYRSKARIRPHMTRTPTAVPVPIPAFVLADSPTSFGDVVSGEGAAVAEEGVLPVDDADSDVDAELVEERPVEVDDGMPNFVLTTLPFPSKIMPRSSMQHLGSLSQQKLPSSHTATLGRNPVPGAAQYSQSAWTCDRILGYSMTYNTDRCSNNP